MRIDTFLGIESTKLNRKKQRMDRWNVIYWDIYYENSIKAVFAGAAISGLFAIFFDCRDNNYFKVKNIPDIMDAIQIIISTRFNVKLQCGIHKNHCNDFARKEWYAI